MAAAAEASTLNRGAQKPWGAKTVGRKDTASHSRPLPEDLKTDRHQSLN
jgi:hypothetical protein